MELKSSGWIILSSCIFFTFDIRNVATLAVSGQRAPCSNEGEIIAVDKIDKQKCFSCICKNGFVECFNYHSCPKISGCHMLIGKSEDECCEKCQGCYYNGKYYESDTEWTDPGDPCKVMRCEAGVVTQSDLQCHVPCDNPLPPMPGKCCQTCPDCRINGQVATDDRDVTSDDPCVKCRCTGGKMTCSKKACPVLQCGKRKQYQPNGECCPRCLGERSHLKVTNICVLGSNIYKEGETKTIDHCTRCKCTNETSVCVRKSCPILDCPLDLQKKRTTDGCCRECSVPEKSQSTCVYNGQTYEEGQSWKLDECSSCSCHREKLRCAKTRCNVTEPCPYGTTLIHPKGECCPICQESEGTCMVFGDPHYKTFDGKIFSFQGLGKYQLVSDCSNHTFSVRVTNDFSNANHSSTATKRVRIKYGDVRVNLGQRYRIRVNGLKVAIPYVNDGKLRIEREEYNLLMTLSNNVKILWNGQSFLEITVPSNYKNKLCGLCGNFNSNVQDDLKMRKGGLAGNSNIFRFGTSWCVGRDCGRLAKKSSQIRQCKVRTYKRPFVENKNPCKYLTSTELFNGCDSKLNNVKYFEACTKDMCDCPNGKCYCESLMAYAQECQRLGVNVANWHKNSYCVGSATIKARVKQKHNKPPRIHSPYSKADIEKYSHQIVAKKNRGNEPIIN